VLFLASLHAQHKDDSEKVFEMLGSALNISEEIKGMDLLSKTRLALFNYYKSQENFKSAVEQLEHHIQLEKDLHINAINQKMLNLEISHKAEKEKQDAHAVRAR